MNRILMLSWGDFTNILREQILLFMFLVAPLGQFSVARWGLPWLGNMYPAVREYYPVILLLLTIQVVAGLGFVFASILLDERDEGVLSAIRVAPVGLATFLTYRLLAGVLISFVYALLMLSLTGLTDLSWQQELAGAVLFALLCPLVVLCMASLSENKVEGLAVFKGLNLVIMLPILSLFFTSKWFWFLAVIPTFWTFQFLGGAESDWGWILVGALIAHTLAFLILTKVFRKRVYR